MKGKFPSLPSVGDLIRLYQLQAKQRLSQNFLLDLKLTDQIVRASGRVKNSIFIEIGPGPGSLTRSLLRIGAKKVIAVEKDERFLPALHSIQQASRGRLECVRADMLHLDEESLLRNFGILPEDNENIKMIGNLPFNVGTELLLKWLRQLDQNKGAFVYGRVPMILLFQKEVADRIVAPVGSKNFTRLSVMVQRLCTAHKAFDIPGRRFVPAPKVDASVVVIDPLEHPFQPKVNIEDIEFLCREIFSQRRKKLSTCITSILGEKYENLLVLSNIDGSKRPQQLNVEEWCNLTHHFSQMKGNEKNTDS